MLPPPRIIVIDDNKKHLSGLAEALNEHGTSCLQILFTADLTNIRRCPHVRVIFADLHLNDSGVGVSHATHFSTIGAILENNICPSGPYVLVLWTKYADQASKLGEFIRERLQGVQKPYAVLALDKTHYIDSKDAIHDISTLVAAIDGLFSDQPCMGALINWEERALGAAAETIAAIHGLAGNKPDADPEIELRRVLRCLAAEGVGVKNVNADRFRAVNEALLPILADRIAFLRSRGGDEAVWEKALPATASSDGLTADEAGRLNGFMHIAEGTGGISGGERGAVILLPTRLAREGFEGAFALSPALAAKEEFNSGDFVDGSDQHRWMLIQAQAACDFAQKQAGPLPFFLALEVSPDARKAGKARGALWESPPFTLGNMLRKLNVNMRFQVSITEEDIKNERVVYRLRDQLLNDLIVRAHCYGVRPGTITFRAK